MTYPDGFPPEAVAANEVVQNERQSYIDQLERCKRRFDPALCTKQIHHFPPGIIGPLGIFLDKFLSTTAVKLSEEMFNGLKMLKLECNKLKYFNCKTPCGYIGVPGTPYAGCTFYDPQLPEVALELTDEQMVFLIAESTAAIGLIMASGELGRYWFGEKMKDEEAQKLVEQFIGDGDVVVSLEKLLLKIIISSFPVALTGSREESLFRDYLLKTENMHKIAEKVAKLLPERFNYTQVFTVISMLVTSTTFSLVHLINRLGGNPANNAQLLLTFIMGIVLYSLRIRYGRVSLPIAVHFVHNSLAVTLIIMRAVGVFNKISGLRKTAIRVIAGLTVTATLGMSRKVRSSLPVGFHTVADKFKDVGGRATRLFWPEAYSAPTDLRSDNVTQRRMRSRKKTRSRNPRKFSRPRKSRKKSRSRKSQRRKSRSRRRR